MSPTQGQAILFAIPLTSHFAVPMARLHSWLLLSNAYGISLYIIEFSCLSKGCFLPKNVNSEKHLTKTLKTVK